uniref:Uncharacterized protein n=1 Tax=Trypanosoma vivax (strain Y486) TaxID=1055687 RepID=G0UC33_TRYVY|nr:conserved hypothetical protein [Trypanosoma vivax Y486]
MLRLLSKAVIRISVVPSHVQRRRNADSKQPYRRRSSDPQTVREKGNFKRDMRFSKYRPLPSVPWLQEKTRTYMDDAERLYGRKETWYRIKEDVVREKLASLLQDYLRDAIKVTRLEMRDALKYKRLCTQMEAQYRAHVSSGLVSPQTVRAYVSSNFDYGSNSTCGTAPLSDSHATGAFQERRDNEHETHLNDASERDASSSGESLGDKMRLKKPLIVGEGPVLHSTAATMDLTKKEERVKPYSAFPFLRQRALENEASLDPSLVHWTAKYFPGDDEGTFASPPKLRSDADLDDQERGEEDTHTAARRAADSMSLPKPSARRRLQRSLRLHEDTKRPTFDAEGAFYRVHRQGDGEERAPKPQPVRGSDVLTERDGEVVKVPWDTVTKAKELGYSPDILRAKERLVRLTRGEDPKTIP